jgi:hypothetical protein
VAVPIKGKPYRLVSQKFLNVLRVRPPIQQRRACVPEIVEPYVGKYGTLEERPILVRSPLLRKVPPRNVWKTVAA